MSLDIHPTAHLIHELNFHGRRITFKEVDRQDRLHTCSGYHNEKWVENYDRTGLPYFICYSFEVYKNEYDFSKNKPADTFIIKLSPKQKHCFPNNQKIKLYKFNKEIKLFHYNKIDMHNTRFTHDEIFNSFCHKY
jgi:hypothetical protein|tara:strand:- start:1757 stop:2161 length:405 start_codon:yes stop_codon:yes gene_type:complete